MLSLHSSPLADLGGETGGGMSVFLREVNRELGRMGHRLDIFTRRDHPDLPAAIEIDQGVRLIHLSAGPAAPGSREEISRRIPQMQKALSQWPAEGYDVIHAHYWLSGAAGIDWAARKRVPFVQMFHTTERAKRRLLGPAHPEDVRRSREEERLTRLADAVTVGSGQDGESLVADYGVPPEKIHIVPGGVNTQTFHPRPPETARQRTGLPRGRIALFVGRLEPVKGLETLIQALATLRREGGDNCSWRLFVIGGDLNRPPGEMGDRSDGSYVRGIRKLAREVRMADRITFLGPKPQDRLADYYAAADCCVFPSVYETFGLAVIEALACGGVVVASEMGGYPPLLAQEKAGLLVPPGDAQALASALDRVCGDSALREDLRRRGPEVGRRFPWSETAQRLLEVYRALTEKGPGRGTPRRAGGARKGMALCG